MSKRTLQFVTAIIGGCGTIAVGCVTYFVEDKTLAAEIVSAIGVVSTAACTCCNIFTKNEE